MSAELLCEAVARHLRAHMPGGPLPPEVCDVVDEGQPIPMAGQTFLGVWEQGWQAVSGNYDLEEEFTIYVTVTRRIGEYPVDKIGPELIYRHGRQMAKTVRDVIAAVHRNQKIRAEANLLDPDIGDTTNGFYTELWFKSAQALKTQGPAWFNADTTRDGYAMCGVSRTLVFGDSRRAQCLGAADDVSGQLGDFK